MVILLWRFLWNKVQASLGFIKIGLSAIVVYFLILSIFARVFQTNKATIYSSSNSNSIKKTDAIYTFISDKKVNSTKTGRIVVSIYKGVACSLVGEACYSDFSKKNPINASTTLASLLAYPFLNPPASGIGSTIQTLADAGFIPKSYAAEGVGFASIRPLMGVWKAMRDISYLLLVLVIVTIGFMIMLRSKINPQTVVSVENALPKIVMSLIYITFSFAIAGFLIDMMYVSLVLIITILGPQQATRATKDLIPMFLQAKPHDIIGVLFNFDFFNIFWRLPEALLTILGSGMGIVLRAVLTGIGAFFLSPYYDRAMSWAWQPDLQASAIVIGINGIIRSLLSFSATSLGFFVVICLASLLMPFILGVIIFLTVIMLFFRIFFLLFSNYVKLLVLIIISPLFLLMEAIPGQATFSTWIKNILELLVPYPIIIATSLIGSIIMETSIKGVLWTPPFIIGLTPDYLSAIIGMWVIFMIPDFIGLVQKMVNPKPLPLDAGIGTFFGGAKTGVETGLGEMSKYALLAGQFAPLKRIFNMIPGFEKK